MSLGIVPLPHERDALMARKGELNKFLFVRRLLKDPEKDAPKPPFSDWPDCLQNLGIFTGLLSIRQPAWCCISLDDLADIPLDALRKAAEKINWESLWPRTAYADVWDKVEEPRSLLAFGEHRRVRDAERELRAAVKKMQRAAERERKAAERKWEAIEREREAARRKRMKEQAMRLRCRMKAWLAALDERPEKIRALIEAAEASPPPRRRWLKAWRLARRCLALGLTLDDLAKDGKE